MTLLHLTINSGHTRDSPRREVSADAIRNTVPLLAVGTHRLPAPLDQYWLDVPRCRHGQMFAVLRAPPLRTILIGGVADTPAAADFLWPVLEYGYLRVTDRGLYAASDFAAPHQPDRTPWLAVALVGHPADLLDCLSWLGDFERVFAWTWLLARPNHKKDFLS